MQSISAGHFHCLALRQDGTVWGWGDNLAGDLGDGTTIDRASPVRVRDLSGIRAIGAGAFWSVAVGEDGALWTWGSNATIRGVLGREHLEFGVNPCLPSRGAE